jgi:hypothetical protein
MSVIHWPVERPAIVESVEARDKRDCIELDSKVSGANRELAQWLKDHSVYTSPEVAAWLGCSESRVRKLRQWADSGFVAPTPFNSKKQQEARERYRYPDTGEALKTNDNFEDDDLEPSDDVEDSAQILTNILDTIKHAKSVAEAYRKILKVSAFDREAKAEIYNAINLLIVKWRTVQSTLDTKGQGNGPQSKND